MKEYSALIMDLKKLNAYSVHDRNLIQEYIMCAIEILNAVFKSSIEKDVAFCRQSIEKTIKTANIYEAKNATVAALNLMHRRTKEDFSMITWLLVTAHLLADFTFQPAALVEKTKDFLCPVAAWLNLFCYHSGAWPANA